jgi:hypothetical protein
MDREAVSWKSTIWRLPGPALKEWLELSDITAGTLLHKVNRGGAVETSRLSPDACGRFSSSAPPRLD